MDAWRSRPFFETHAHIGGCLRADDLIELIGSRDIDWSGYEQAYARVYGRATPLREILAAVRGGEPAARRRFRDLFVFGDDSAGDFDRFSAKFMLIACATALSSPELAHRVPQAAADEIRFCAERIAAGCRAAGIAGCELRFHLGANRPLAIRRELYCLLLRALATESRDGVDLRLAISLPREAAFEAWGLVQELALGEHGDRLTAIDFCHVEEGFPPKLQRSVADGLRRFNAEHPGRRLALLYHVGESFRDMSVESAVRWCHEASVDLGAHRLGHAIALGVDPAHFGAHRRRERVGERLDQIRYDLAHADGLRSEGVDLDPNALTTEARVLAGRPADEVIHVDYAYRRLDQLVLRQRYACRAIATAGSVVEVCPTSNRRIAGFTDPACHQLHRFRDVGLPFVVGADDPGILDTDLASEVAWVVEHARLSPAEAVALVDRSWTYRSEVMSGRSP